MRFKLVVFDIRKYRKIPITSIYLPPDYSSDIIFLTNMNSYKSTHALPPPPPTPIQGDRGGGRGRGEAQLLRRRLKKYRPSLKNQTSFDNGNPPPSICQKQIPHWKIGLLKIMTFAVSIAPGQCRNFTVCYNHFYMPMVKHMVFYQLAIVNL